MLSPHQEKYLAWALTRKRNSSDEEKFTGVLTEAKVDLNPHQIEAALFAFKSPLSRGAILADEVGLGKTIEAAIVISQNWAERKRHILVITPASLRKQWSTELESKFYLPTLILERKNFNTLLNSTYSNPFDTEHNLIICSYQFAKKQIELIARVNWDLVVIDEAHKLRNVYKPNSKTSNVIKNSLSPYKKLLLTATPLHNDIKELYGLISVIDDKVFGNVKGFADRYGKVALRGKDNFIELRKRIQPIIHRTLRKDVQEYVKYTERIPFVQEYYPSDAEEELYERVTSYLNNDKNSGIPSRQRQLIEMIFYKLLSSSSFAIAGTLKTIINRLNKLLNDYDIISEELSDTIVKELDVFDEYAEEWADEEDEEFEDNEGANNILTQLQYEEIKEEINELEECYKLAMSISSNNKGKCLLKALNVSFENKSSNNEPEKALIFTESRRTQEYLKNLLESNGYKGMVVLFNGANTDSTSKVIYNNWLEINKGTSKISDSKTANKRQAIVDYFADTAKIMIATEAGAEGMNFQFCSLVVNYDMPWNPQRVEQRIGRCHRYGQRNDVVVVNFVNKSNRADQRIYELLDQKFNLFKGVFGASDKVLGKIMDGVDFERRILSIYRNCRDVQEIDAAFDALQEEMKENIEATLSRVQTKLLENFDEDVIRKLKMRRDNDLVKVSQYSQLLWQLTISKLHSFIEIIDSNNFKFLLRTKPDQLKNVSTGNYQLAKDTAGSYIYRIGHPLAQWVVDTSKNASTPDSNICFDYTGYGHKVSIFDRQKGKNGLLSLYLVRLESINDNEEQLIFVVQDRDGNILDDDFAMKLLSLKPISITTCQIDPMEKGRVLLNKKIEALSAEVGVRNKKFLNEEIDKIENWADDQTLALEQELKETKRQLREKTRFIKTISRDNLLELTKETQYLQKLYKQKREELTKLEDEVALKQSELITKATKSLDNKIEEELLFSIKWSLV